MYKTINLYIYFCLVSDSMCLKSFRESKDDFNENYENEQFIDSIVPVNGEMKRGISIKNADSSNNEEFYKWQFIYSIISSGLYNKDYIGAEVFFPKGNPHSTPLKMDGAIFDDKEWINHYKNFWANRTQEDLDWLRKHLIIAIEFKNEKGNKIETYYNQQLKPAMKESEKDFVIGFYYDHEKLWIFQKENSNYSRYDDTKNGKGNSELEKLSLHLPDSYNSIPSFNDILNNKKIVNIDFESMSVDDLEPISGIKSNTINEDLYNITFTLDTVSLNSNIGYHILIEILALKIFDERYNSPLQFYILDEEKDFDSLQDNAVQNFINRMKNIFDNAKGTYTKILGSSAINWRKEQHVRVIISIVDSFQNYSFIKSYKTDLYQLVFYKFSSEFAKDQKGQFLTPLGLINFLVNIVNPRGNERLIDPCTGISDFLSVSYVNSEPKLNDSNLYGIDNDEHMVMLSQLNMLLNGDGNAKIEHVPGYGSINKKFDISGNIVELNHDYHQNGNWDNWVDETELMKFDVVLTNPPFGKGRAFKPKNNTEKKIAELYELWNGGTSIDEGILFLENAVRLLKENGRFGIVLSNSIASVDRDVEAREWLMNNVRIVALFELPTNVFADTNVNTVLIVGYKPDSAELERLKENDYEIFAKTIENVGYEVNTVNKIKTFKKKYKIDEKTFEVVTDENGEAFLAEDFSIIVKEFKEWAITQEETLKQKFLGDL